MAVSKIERGADGTKLWAFTNDTVDLPSDSYYSFPQEGYVWVSATTDMTLYFSGYNYIKIMSVIVKAGEQNLFYVKQGMIGRVASGTGAAKYSTMVHN